MARSASSSHPTRAPSGVRERTRGALLDAALRVFARKGVGGTAIHEIAAEAGVANGTFYNYFRTREEVLEGASRLLAKRLADEVSASYARIDDPVERLSIGCRRFMLKALEDPTWGAGVLRVWASAPLMSNTLNEAMVADLRAGRRRGAFHYKSERAAADLVQGTVLAAMRSVLEGHAGEEHAEAIASLVLRGLGVEDDVAKAVARRPLPPLVRAPVLPAGTRPPQGR
jgi:AcrR family transcriptional regulator